MYTHTHRQRGNSIPGGEAGVPVTATPDSSSGGGGQGGGQGTGG